jgi:hypothetical protein
MHYKTIGYNTDSIQYNTTPIPIPIKYDTHTLRYNTVSYNTTQIQYDTIQYPYNTDTVQCHAINAIQYNMDTIPIQYNTTQYNTDTI